MLNRKLLPLLIAVGVLLSSSVYANAFEAKGSAIVGGVYADYHGSTKFFKTFLYITNVTGSDVDCRVTIYDHSGDDVTSDCCTIFTGSSSSASVVTIGSGADIFSLPAGASRMVRVAVTNARCIIGHAVVEWSSEDRHVKKALVVAGDLQYRRGNSFMDKALPVIGGQPF